MTTASEPTHSPEEIEHEKEDEHTEALLRQQLEFYFSRQNLAHDKYLLSQMNSQKYVSVAVIAGFPKVRALAKDNNALLIKVMKTCKNLSLDDTEGFVCPNLKNERNTLILRDLPEASYEEVKALFSLPGCPAEPIELYADVGGLWLASFENQSECLRTSEFLRGQLFKNEPIHVRVKSDFGFSAVPQVNPWEGYYYPPAYGYPPYMPPPYWPPQSYYVPPERERGERHRGKPPSRRFVKDASGAPEFVPHDSSKPRRRPHFRGNGRSRDAEEPAARVYTPELDPQDFPALPGPGSAKKPAEEPAEILPAAPASSSSSSSSGEVSRKYTREEMAEIVQKLVDRRGVKKPASFGDNNTIVADAPLEETQLLEPMPVIYPASPSPVYAAQSLHSSDIIPFLDLDIGFFGPPPVLPVGVPVVPPAGAVASPPISEVVEIPNTQTTTTTTTTDSKGPATTTTGTGTGGGSQHKYAQKPTKNNNNSNSGNTNNNANGNPKYAVKPPAAGGAKEQANGKGVGKGKIAGMSWADLAKKPNDIGVEAPK